MKCCIELNSPSRTYCWPFCSDGGQMGGGGSADIGGQNPITFN